MSYKLQEEGISLSDKEQQEYECRISFRLTREEMGHMEELQRVMEERLRSSPFGRYVRVTQRMVVMEALDALEYKWKEQDRKRRLVERE